MTEPRTHPLVIGGTRVAVREHGSPSASASLVFLPALGVPLRYYDRLLSSWADTGRHVLAVEWRGMPESPVGYLRRARFGYADLLRTDLPAVVRLARERGAPDIVLVGHSLGGQLAVLAAAGGVVEPAGVVTLATGTSSPGHLPPAGRLLRRTQVTVVRTVSAVLGHWPGHRLGFAGRQPRTMMRDWAHEARHGRYRLQGDDTDHEEALAAAHVPTLLVAFAGDRMIPPAAVDHLARRIGGPVDQRTIDVPGADHFSWARRAPAAVVDQVEKWLADEGLV